MRTKKRIFYVINLDRNRIMMLLFIMAGFVLVAFATGYRLALTMAGSETARNDTLIPTDDTRDFLDPAGENREETEGGIDFKREENSASNPGRSIYSLDSPSGGGKERGDTIRSEPETSLKSKADVSDKKSVTTSRRKETTRTTEQKSKDKKTAHRDTRNQTTKSATPQKSEKKPEKISKTPAKQNPRAAVLDYSGSVNMANISEGKESPATTAQTQYTLQLGAFSSRTAAERMSGTLKSLGVSPYIEKSGNLYLVRVGSASKSSDLNALKTKLDSSHFSYLVVKKR